MNDETIRGGCLCGVVKFEALPPLGLMIHCHCSRCRKASGSSHGTTITLPPGQLRWLCGEEAITKYEHPTAPGFGKWFCKHCGCPLPRPIQGGRLAVIPAGSVDSELPVRPSDHIFWGSRPAWGCPSDGLPTHTEYPEAWVRAARATEAPKSASEPD